MFNFPESTQIKKPLPKMLLYKKFEFTNSQKEKFDADVSRMELVNEISTQTIPSLKEGKNVRGIYVLGVMLKNKGFDTRNIEKLAKTIPQNIIFALQFENEVQVAVFYEKTILGSWQKTEDAKLKLLGLDLDSVWENIICSIEGGEFLSELSLDENIARHEQQEKINKQIKTLQTKIAKETQFNRQIEMSNKIRELRKSLELGVESWELRT